MTHPLACMLVVVAGCATTSRFARLDDEVRDRAARDEFSGVVLVARDGSPEWFRAYGDVTADTCFHLASASKMFTLVAVQQLLDTGQLHRDDRVGTFVPSYAAAADVTVAQLLAHTSGLPAGVGPEFFAAVAANDTLDGMIGALASPLEAPPGSRMQYSNIGFLILGRIVEVVSRESFERYVQDHIARPAGMTRTAASANGCATPMTRGLGEQPPGTPRRAFPAPRATPAGGWTSTARDLLRLVEALRLHRIVAGDSGLPIRRWDGHQMLGHNGGAPGMNAEVWMFPATGDAAIVLSNYDPPAATTIADDIATVITGSAPPPAGAKLRMLRR